MARYTSLVMTLVLLAVLALPVQAGDLLQEKYRVPVGSGISWLVPEQKSDGSWGEPPDPTLCNNNLRVEKTAFAVMKMLDRARELQQSPPPAVESGLHFLLTKVQADGSIWDYYPYNVGLCKESIPPIVPETSAAIMAIVSAGTPDRVFEDSSYPPLPAAGKTYKQVVEEASAYLAWAQKGAGCAEPDCPDDVGGWSYARDDSIEAIRNQPADQVNTGYAALALVFAEEKNGVFPGPDTKIQLGKWIVNTQDSSGGATLEAWGGTPKIQYTGALLIEQHLLGLDRSNDPDLQVKNALGFIDIAWAPWAADMYQGALGRYTVTTGLVLMDVDTLDGGSVDWFDALTDQILSEQVTAGEEAGSWQTEPIYGDYVLSTSWSLLALEGKLGAVGDGNIPPVANGQWVTTSEDTPVAITLSGFDADGDPIVYAITSQPVNCEVTGEPPSVTYYPATDFSGDDFFTFTVNDGSVDSAPATVFITVTAVNDDPVANGQAIVTTEDTPVAFTLEASDIDGDPLSYIVLPPSHGTLTGTSPDLTYTPAPDFFGDDSFTFTVNDGTVDSNIATVSITVTMVNDAPSAGEDTYTTEENLLLTVAAPGVLQNDQDADGDSLEAFIVTGPGHGTIVLNPDGSLTYSPETNYFGPDSFTYRATDSQASSADTMVIITVTERIPVLIDIKPGSCPNAFNLDDKGIVSVAVVGTTDFDVTRIDPSTVKLNGVAALKNRWDYEDVATPYIDTNPANDPNDCHELEGDGLMDLTLKFDLRVLAASLPSGITLKGDAVPLILTGNLKPEFGGTPLAGSDHIWVVM